MSNASAAADPAGSPIGQMAKIFVLAALVVLAAEAIGNVVLPLGGTYKVVLLPLLWALLIGLAYGIAAGRLPKGLALDVGQQQLAAAVLQPALMLFIAKLGLLVGGALPKILASGWALAFQEFGHFFGTMVFGLPVALLLGIKREAIGATFSVGREPSLAIIGEKFGMDGPEGRGVLAEYMTGTVFGAIFIAIFAGFVTSLHIFDPLALAMGAGVGSGSLMAAASGAIAAQQTPEVAKDVAAFAAASNLITTTVGTYFTLFLSLPFTIWAYKVLEPLLGRFHTVDTSAAATAAAKVDHAVPKLSPAALVAVWVISGIIALIGNTITYKTAPSLEVFEGLALILAPVVVGYFIYRATRGVVPAVVWVSVIAMAMTYPATPYAAEIAALTGKINFLALATPLLAYAGLSIAKDLPAFRALGWRIVVVSLMANAGTFLGAVLIAQFFMHKPV